MILMVTTMGALAQARATSVQTDLDTGWRFYQSGQRSTAYNYVTHAFQVAYQNNNTGELLKVSLYFLAMGHDDQAIRAYTTAHAAAIKHGNRDPLQGMRHTAAVYNYHKNTLKPRARKASTKRTLQHAADQVLQNYNYYSDAVKRSGSVGNGRAPGPATHNRSFTASSVHNSMSAQISRSHPHWTLRGFGNPGNSAMVAVPFVFNTGRQPNAVKATLRVQVMPLNDRFGSSIMLKGASGRTYNVASVGRSYPRGRWTEVTVDLSSNYDLIQALYAGRLEGITYPNMGIRAPRLTVVSE